MATLASVLPITWATLDGIQLGRRVSGTKYNQMLCEDLILIAQRLTTAQESVLEAELDSIVYNWNPGGRILDKDGALLYDYMGDWGIIQSVAAEGGAVGQNISNTGFQCYDTTGRFQVVREVAGPNGILGKSILATAGSARKISKRNIPNSSGTWSYYIYDASAATWLTSPAGFRSGTTQTDFELDTNDRLFIASDLPSNNLYNIRHTP